jgi:hypothetical protein
VNDYNPGRNEREELTPESIHKTSHPDKEASKKQNSSQQRTKSISNEDAFARLTVNKDDSEITSC